MILSNSDKAPPSLSETSKSGGEVLLLQGDSRLPGRGATWGSYCTVHGLEGGPLKLLVALRRPNQFGRLDIAIDRRQR